MWEYEGVRSPMAPAWHQNISTSNDPVFASLHLELDHLLLIVAILGQQLKGEIVLSSSPFRSSFGVFHDSL